MESEFRIREFQNPDLKDMLDIFNKFAKTSSAVYCDFELTIEQFKKLLELARKILIVQNGRKIIGFGFVGSYKPFPNFNHTAVLTYFLRQEYTGNGFGTKLLGSLISKGKEAGITNFLAHISSKNQQSLNFHKKHGFEEVGRFKSVGAKFGEYFDVVWMQKHIKLENEDNNE